MTLQSRNLITWLTPLYTWQKDAMNWKTPKLGWKFYRFLNLVLKNRKYFFPTINYILILHSFFLIEFSFSFIMLSFSPTLTGNYFVSIFFNIVIHCPSKCFVRFGLYRAILHHTDQNGQNILKGSVPVFFKNPGVCL